MVAMSNASDPNCIVNVRKIIREWGALSEADAFLARQHNAFSARQDGCLASTSYPWLTLQQKSTWTMMPSS
jgi:hypothetical protein